MTACLFACMTACLHEKPQHCPYTSGNTHIQTNLSI